MRAEQQRHRRHGNEQQHHGRHGNSLVGLAAMVLVAWALLQELRKPAAERTWTGTVAGVVPYDFRRPTLARARQRLWAPDNPRIIVPRAFGVGWTLNVGRLVSLVRRARSDRADARSPGATAAP
jgi:uncharacterized protein DUF5808